MKATLLVFLSIVFAIGNLGAQEPDRPPVKVEAATEISRVKVPYEAAIDSVSGDYKKTTALVETWYLGELEKLQTARTKLGDLDGAVAAKAERERIAAHTSTTPEQIQAMPAPLRTLRGAYEPALKRVTDDRARKTEEVRRKYLADLEVLQKRITMTGDLDQALLVKAEKERFVAESAANPGSVVVPTPPLAAVKPVATPAPAPLGTRPAQKMTIYVSGCNYCALHINGKEVTKFVRDRASKVELTLREGDVIAARLGVELKENSLWLSCLSSTGEFLFETDDQWVNYIPADPANWSLIKDAKEQKAVQLAPDEQISVGHVKKAAAATPLYSGAQPIKGTLSNEPKAVYLYRVVTKLDLVPKKDPKK